MHVITPVSNKDLVNFNPLISLMIKGAPGSLFLIVREFIIIKLIFLLNWIFLGYL